MTDKTIDVVGIGNAIVDIVSQTDDAFLTQHGIERNAMNLVDEDTSAKIYKDMGPGIEISGGSAANTIAAIAQLGSKGAYIGKVKDDDFGVVFRHDIEALGVHFETEPAMDGPSTARCLVLVTDDGARSMNTYLGACVGLGPDDVPQDLIAASKVVYLEGYLWDPPQAKEAFLKAATIAHQTGGKVALSLSDPFCVDRHRAEFIDLVKHHVDILFANEAEIMSLYQVENFDDALQAVRWETDVAALTRSEKGSVILERDEVHIVDADEIKALVDTTGAGDLYAAGFLHGYVTGAKPAVCGRMGSVAAAEIIQHYGARSEEDLVKLMAEKLG